jgi:DNA invertase Pin-like site-specific DNA recombinase
MVLDLVDELTRHGVTLVSCKETWDTGTPQGQFVLTVFAALGQLERD